MTFQTSYIVFKSAFQTSIPDEEINAWNVRTVIRIDWPLRENIKILSYEVCSFGPIFQLHIRVCFYFRIYKPFHSIKANVNYILYLFTRFTKYDAYLMLIMQVYSFSAYFGTELPKPIISMQNYYNKLLRYSVRLLAYFEMHPY